MMNLTTSPIVQVQQKAGGEWQVLQAKVFGSDAAAVRYAKWFKREWAYGVRAADPTGKQILWQSAGAL